MIVLDTHIVVWLSFTPERLSTVARTAIQEARRHGDGLAISDTSLLEIAQMLVRGRLTIDTDPDSYVDDVERMLTVLPVTAGIAKIAAGFGAHYPKDPMDRLIGATALKMGCNLITADDRIHKSREVKCIW